MPRRAPASSLERLLLVYELPAGKSTLRVAIWRRLQRLGAEALGGAAYALPVDAESRESFEWLRGEIVAAGGRAALFDAREVAGVAASSAIGAPSQLDRRQYQGRTWVTRPRPGVDRMASAWLIRRFVDPRARFAFAERPPRPGGRRLGFDMYGAEFGHRSGGCTFENLVERFGLVERGLAELGRLVRAVDLHEEAADPAAAAMLERLVAGLRAAHADDGELLAAGATLFEALYAAPPATAGRRKR